MSSDDMVEQYPPTKRVGPELLGVSSKQLLYWNHLSDLFHQECVEFIAGGFILLPTLREWSVLQLLYNNVFIQLLPPLASEENPKIDDINSNIKLSVNLPYSAIYMPLCPLHGMTEWMRVYEQDPLFYTVTTSAIESIPIQIHPNLYQALVWYQQNWIWQPEIDQQPKGLFRAWLATTATPELNNDNNTNIMSVIPWYISSVIELEQCMTFHSLKCRQLYTSRIHHISCRYCFPSLYGAVIHSLEKNYECSVSTIPAPMWSHPLFQESLSTLTTTPSIDSLNNDYLTEQIQYIRGHVQRFSTLWTETNPSLIYKRLLNRLWNSIQQSLQKQQEDGVLYLSTVEQYNILMLYQFERQLVVFPFNQHHQPARAKRALAPRRGLLENSHYKTKETET